MTPRFETVDLSIEVIANAVGDEDAAFFNRASGGPNRRHKPAE